MTLDSNSGAKMFPEIEWCQTFDATPNQRSDAVDHALRVGEPVKDIPHIRRDPAKPRYAAHNTGCRSLLCQCGGVSRSQGSLPLKRECYCVSLALLLFIFRSVLSYL